MSNELVFNISLKRAELDYILNVLADKPLREVVNLFNSLQMQASAQLQEQTEQK